MMYMYSIRDKINLGRPFTLNDLVNGLIEVRLLDEAVMDADDALPREDRRVWWPVNDVDGWSWDAVEVADVREAFQHMLERQALDAYDSAHDL